MAEDDRPARPLDDLTDEQLVEKYQDDVAAGRISVQLMMQVERRGIECLASAPDMQATVQTYMDEGREQFKRMLTSMGWDDGLGAATRDLIHPNTPSTLDLMGITDRPNLSILSPAYEIPDYSELAEQMAKTSPAALNDRLIDTLEVGFGSIQQELVEQRDTLEGMRLSLETVEENTPRKLAGWVVIGSAVIAAIASVAAVIIALAKP